MIAERIGFLGGGKIAQSLAKGFISAGLTKGENLIASCHPKDKASLEAFQNLGAESVTENSPVVQKSDILFVSVKPNVVPEVLNDVRSESGGKLFISIAMGIPVNQVEKSLLSDSRVIRVMPNMPCLVRKGCSVFTKGLKATEKDAKITQQLFEAIGTCEEVSESHFDSITALSGSGPAYVYVMIEAMADGGVKMGLPRDLAYRLAAQTVLGAGEMVKSTGTHPAQLKDDVSSPGGSTIRALHYLERRGFREALIGAVEQATMRCQEISKQ